MVVRDRLSGRWMLPGGLRSGREFPNQTARRETREEAGLRLRRSQLQRKVSKNGVTLYAAENVVPRSRSARRKAFHSRRTKHETSDYGFVDIKSRRLVVTDYAGKRKAKSGSFRKGTVSLLRRA
jgi:8-oxo-dGTP pyrophosphatase MutT (NUDIX family)